MAIDSPLGSLCKVLKQLRDSANRHEEVLKRSEAATRATLVDPLLRALGWDITDVTMVEVEKTKGEFRADYVLLDSHSNIKAIIEAKALGETLTDHKTVVKLFSYAANFHCNSVFITDGRHWHHYTEMNIMDTTPSRVLKINNDDLIDVAAYFVQRIDASWYRNQVVSDDPTLQLRQIQQQMDEMAMELKVLKDASKQPSMAQIGKEADSYRSMELLGDMQGKSVAGLRIDGQAMQAKSWTDVIVHVAEYVLSHAQIDLPISAAGNSKILLLSAEPYKKGIRHHVISGNSGPVYLHINYCANDIIKNSLHMLQLLPENQRKVELLVAEK